MTIAQLTIAIVIGLTQAAPPAPRPAPPTRDPNTPGYVTARELPDGAVPPPDADGNFIIGPTHRPAPEAVVQDGVPQGTVYNFTMSSANSRIYPGIARDAGTFGTVDPGDPAKLVVTTSHPAPYTRRVAVYVPRQYVPGTAAPFIDLKLTKDPEGRAAMGGSSGGAAALIMAWYHPELYHRVLTYSLTAVNQQWPPSAETPHGAWEFHERLIPNNPAKPLRLWLEVGDRDLFNPNVMRDNMHDWVVANENMARVLAAKGYHYQFVFARNAGHTDRTVKQQTLGEALEWLWKGYR
jgi:hypothetical protein